MTHDRLRLVIAWALLAFAASLLRFKTVLSGDALFLDHLATDLFIDGGRWSDWKFPVAPSFVPDMLLYFAAFPLLPDAATRIFAVSAAQALLIAAASVWFARAIHPALSRRAMAAIVLATALVTLAAARSNMWLYFYSTNNHIAVLLFGFSGIVAAMRYLERPSLVRALWLPLSVAAASVSTGLFLLTGTVPALLALGFSWLVVRGRRGLRGKVAALLVQVLGGVALAELLTKAVLIAHPALEGKVRSTPETAVRALALFWQTVVAAFDRGNRHTFALALLLLAALLFLGWRLVRSLRVEGGALRLPLSDQPGITAAAVMLAWTLPVTVIGAVASSRFADEYALRYFLFPLGLAAVLAIVLLDRSRRRWPWDVALVAGALFVGIGSAHTLRKATPLPKSHLIADCLIGLHKQGVNLQAGISEYWMGPLVREYLPWHPPILNTLNDLQPNFWASTIGPLLRPERYPHESYTFALIRPARDTFGYNYTAATVGQVLPKPARIHVCETDTEVWLYDDMALDTAVRKAGADYLRAKKIRP